MSKPTVMFTWGVSGYYGWGVYGLNLIVNWAGRPDFSLCSTLPINLSQLEVDPLDRLVIEKILFDSRDVHARLKGLRGSIRLSCVVLRALGNNLFWASGSADLKISGTPTIGVAFFEATAFDKTVRERAGLYPLIVVGSTWNRDVLASLGIDHVRVVLQGIDPTYFHPAPRTGRFASRFIVFSGGKLERRKGQDLVIRAFRAFAERHRDAILLTAWSSPWAEHARTLNVNPSIMPVLFRSDGQVDALAWTEANGISSRQVLHLGPLPNAQMPRILREVDVALFPNRAEGGTNLVAMECMACGIPTILSANTGHLDLIERDNCFVLERQRPVRDQGCDGWGESDVDEIIEALESAYDRREEAAERGRRGAATMSRLTWARQLDQLAAIIHPYLNSYELQLQRS
jgi:glycosyltransferase involved in cell wall biosynthesis